MLDFNQELDKLLALETEPLPQTAGEELAASEVRLLSLFNKTQNDVSLQVEEIYDIVKDIDTAPLAAALQEEKSRAWRLLGAVIGICDIIEDFCVFAQKSEDADLIHQADLMWKNAVAAIESCGITQTGTPGEPFNPNIHTARGAVSSDAPRESVVEALQSGYRYMGETARKAAVILSKGMEESIVE